MSWVKIDDGLPNNRKWKRLMRRCPEASALWVSALCWSSSNLTDGRIDADDLEDVVPVRRPHKLAEALVEVGLWERDGDDYVIHDYHDQNPSAAEVLAKREEERQRKAAQRKRGQQNTGRGEDGKFCPNGVPPGHPPGHPPDDQEDAPPESRRASPATRPVPSPKTPSSSTSDSRPAANGTDDDVSLAVEAEVERQYAERTSAAVVAKEGRVVSPAAWKDGARRQVRAEVAAHGLSALKPPGESTVAAAWELAKRNEAERCPVHGRLEPDDPLPDCPRCRAVVGAGR